MQTDGDLRQAIVRLGEEVSRLNEHRFIRIHNSTLSVIWHQFLRGLAFGLGTAIGATALVSVLVVLMRQVEFVPILGDLASRVIDEIQQDSASGR